MKKTVALMVVLLAAAALFTSQAFAAVEYDYSKVWSGDTPGGTGDPWLSANFSDVAGGVKLLLTAGNLVGSEFVGSWAFDFRPDVSFTAAQTEASKAVCEAKKIEYSKSKLGTKMNLYFDFDSSNSGGGVKRFTDNEQVEFLLTGSGINADSFANAFTAAHIQGIGSNGKGSSWVTVTPEPLSAGLFILGGAALAVIRRRKF